ncbi:MAG: hypothetical protein U0V74_01345 [Chitinophagales bacterium]
MLNFLLPDNYKFKGLYSFASPEWLINQTKSYRDVFDQSEINYLYVHLWCYNKQFDRRNWKCKVGTSCYRYVHGVMPELVCNQVDTVEVSSDKVEFFVEKGWGDPNYGGYWRPGVYYWDAFIDGNYLGRKVFFIYNRGLVTAESNPYFDIESLRFFAGGYDAPREKRNYVTAISPATQYLYTELNLKNKFPAEWRCQVFFRWYTGEGQSKTVLTDMVEVNQGDEHIQITRGWGHDTPGTWIGKRYRVEIVFMDVIIHTAYIDAIDDTAVQPAP